jgi:hypothetical protein
LFYYVNSGEQRQEEEGPGAEPDEEADLPTDSLFLVSPRVGYAIPFSDMFAFWPRGGITYAASRAEADNGDEISASVFALSVEAMFAITPVDHVAILLGPYLDIGLTGEAEEQDVGDPAIDRDIGYLSFGASAALGIWF